MVFLKVFLLLVIFATTVLSVPLSTTNSAQVSCFASGPAAPASELYSATYDFCANDFPTDRIKDNTFVGNSFTLASGSIALIQIDLDPIVTDWTFGDCLRLLAEDIKECEINGQSTGGVYNPIETGATQFTVKVFPPENPATTKAVSHSPSQAMCFDEGAIYQPMSVPEAWVATLIARHCTYLDGKTLGADEAHTDTSSWGVPTLSTSTRAFVPTTFSKNFCLRYFDAILRECTSSQAGFFGGITHHDSGQYQIIVSNASATDEGNTTDAKRSELAERFVDDESAGPFNATDSTHARFETFCNSFPWYDDPTTITSDQAERTADYLCFAYNFKHMAEGEQAPLNFDTTPALFANVIALESLSLTTNDCNFAYDTVLNACTWNGLLYGGAIVLSSAKFVLEVPLGGQIEPLTNSESKVFGKIVDLTTVDTTLRVRSSSNTPYDATASCSAPEDVRVKWYAAFGAAYEFCSSLDHQTYQPGFSKTHTYPEGDLWVKTQMQITEASGTMDYQSCIELFDSAIRQCRTDNETTGGTLQWSPYSVGYYVTDLSNGSYSSSSNQTPQDLTTPSNDPGHSGSGIQCDPVGSVWATDSQVLNAIHEFCLTLPAGSESRYWQEGAVWILTGISRPWDAVVGSLSCVQAFGNIVMECKGGNQFSGGQQAQLGTTYDLGVFNKIPEEVATDKSTHGVSRPSGRTQDCIIAEATPVDKQIAGNAISKFCRQFSGHTIAGNTSVSNTISVGNTHIGMTVSAIAEEGYMLYAQNCIGTFERLLTKCSGGVSDMNTKGGTLMFDSAAFTLNTVPAPEE